MAKKKDEEKVKFIRMTFVVDDKPTQYFIDAPYNNEQTQQENCDSVLKIVYGNFKDQNVLAVIRLNDTREMPAFLNLKHVKYIECENVQVFETK
jgi:hypothetical protein